MSKTTGAADDGAPGRDPGLVAIDGCRVRAGSTSWADRGLVSEGRFYPRRTMTARERLAYYAERLPVAEITTTYRFPPTPELCAQWAERTPPGFCFDLRAWSLLSGCPTLPDSLWPDLQAAVAPARRDNRRLYDHHLPAEVLDECWVRFRHALSPLVDTGRLGVVVVRYPSWFGPRPQAWAELAALPARLPGVSVAVELRGGGWLGGDRVEGTLEWLEEHGLGFVCVDGPGDEPPVVAATADVAVVRFVGRRSVPGEPWTWPYRYRPEELARWLPAIGDLAASSREVHLLLDNGGGTDAVVNALALLDAVREGPARSVA